MYNYRIKKIICDLERELSRSADEQIEELFTLVKGEYDQRFKTADKTKGENKWIKK